jgi:hypothetical protein
MFAKLSYTWALMGASWDVLKKDSRLLIFPLLSGICCIIVLASFVVPMTLGDRPMIGVRGNQSHITIDYVLMFLLYFINYFIITFFNTAIIACAVAHMSGGQPTIAGGFREACARIHLILGWALVSATVGLVLRIIEERSKLVGRIVAGLLGAAWTVLTYLVVPILVVEQKGPFAALKESATLFKRTWGEQLVGNFSFGLIFFLLSLPALALAAFGIYAGASLKNTMLAVAAIGVAILYMVVLSLIQSALQSIFQAAVYMYTRGVTGGPQGFPVKLLQDAMSHKES